MHINKNDLIKRLIVITRKDASEFTDKTIETLSSLYESYASDGERRYIDVPYKDKGLAKILGARYDGEKKKWYIHEGVDEKLFSRWM